MATFDLNNRVRIVNPCANNDSLYGPYSSLEEANTSIGVLLTEGRTIAIEKEDGKLEEYWYMEGEEGGEWKKKSPSIDVHEEKVTYTGSTISAIINADTKITRYEIDTTEYSKSIADSTQASYNISITVNPEQLIAKQENQNNILIIKLIDTNTEAITDTDVIPKCQYITVAMPTTVSGGSVYNRVTFNVVNANSEEEFNFLWLYEQKTLRII